MSQDPALHPLLLAANEHHKAGRLSQAEALYRQILQQDPNHAEALHLLGVLANQLQHHEAAKDLILRAIAVNPGHPRYYSNLGEVYRPMKNFPAAIAAYRQAIALEPRYYPPYGNLAITLYELGRYDEAKQVCHQAIALDPDQPHAWHTLGNIYKEERRYDQAYEAYQKTLARDPHSAKTHHNLAVLLRHQGKLPPALQAYETALGLDPNLADIHLNYAITLLLAGNFPRGWEEYEWRWKTKDLPSPIRNFSQPLWGGDDLAGKTILLHTEQGFGDAIHFARYIPLVAQRDPKEIVMECHAELLRLFQSIPHITLIPCGHPLPPFDIHAPFMSLPRAFHTTLETIPNTVPYLYAPPERTTHFRNLLTQDLKLRTQHFRSPADPSPPTPDPSSLRIGLAWAGRPTHREDRDRSLHLSALAPLFAIPNISFVSLQKGPAAGQIAETGLPILDFSAHLQDFQDTAALICALDLVIAVDTSVVHLAGALARPVWTLLPFAPDWRWLLERADSPWYPTMRLFRPAAPNSWPAIIAQVVSELRNLATSNVQRQTPNENDPR